PSTARSFCTMTMLLFLLVGVFCYPPGFHCSMVYQLPLRPSRPAVSRISRCALVLLCGKEVNLGIQDFVSQCDVITVNCPLHEGTRGLVNADLLKHFKKGAWLVNTARGAICDKD